MTISPSAIVNPSAKIHSNAEICAYAVIGANVEIGSGTIVESHAVIQGPTKIGANNHIYSFASIGNDPEDMSYTKGQESKLTIGDDNIIHEFCSIDRGMEIEVGLTTYDDYWSNKSFVFSDRANREFDIRRKGVDFGKKVKPITKIHSNNMLMPYVRIANNCLIGSHVIMGNNTSISSHVVVADWAILGGFVVVNKFCFIGNHSNIGMGCHINEFVPSSPNTPKETIFPWNPPDFPDLEE
jgi:UDP-N-acetylglucosamine acyltransferase